MRMYSKNQEPHEADKPNHNAATVSLLDTEIYLDLFFWGKKLTI